MNAKNIIDWESRFRGQQTSNSAKADAFGAESETLQAAEEAEKESFLKKSGSFFKSLPKKDVTELAALSTLVLFAATVFDRLVIKNIPKRKPKKSSKRLAYR